MIFVGGVAFFVFVTCTVGYNLAFESIRKAMRDRHSDVWRANGSPSSIFHFLAFDDEKNLNTWWASQLLFMNILLSTPNWAVNDPDVLKNIRHFRLLILGCFLGFGIFFFSTIIRR